MARKPRVEAKDGFYHVVTRGNRREPIFFGAWSGMLFIRELERAAKRYAWEVIAFCLMTNHYHLILRISDRGLSRGMAELNGRFALLSNKNRRTSDHLFGRRFWAEEIESDSHLLAACRYTLLNPERAGVVADAREWPWCSLAATLGLAHGPTCLRSGVLLRYLNRDPVVARARFAEFIESGRGRKGHG